MTDEQIKELADKAWNDYISLTKRVFGERLPDNLADFMKVAFCGGYFEGWRNAEEIKEK